MKNIAGFSIDNCHPFQIALHLKRLVHAGQDSEDGILTHQVVSARDSSMEDVGAMATITEPSEHVKPIVESQVCIT